MVMQLRTAIRLEHAVHVTLNGITQVSSLSRLSFLSSEVRSVAHLGVRQNVPLYNDRKTVILFFYTV